MLARRCWERCWSTCRPSLSTQLGTRERATCLQTMASCTLRAALTLLSFARRLLLWSTSRVGALAMHSSGDTMSNLGLVVLLHVERTVEFHDNAVHDEHLDHAGIERVHHANDVVNIASRQLLSQRL